MPVIPTLDETAEELAPLIKALEASHAEEPHDRTVSASFELSLVDAPEKLTGGITSLYLRRQDELCARLEASLGPEWLVRGDHPTRAAMWNDKFEHRDVYISPARMAMFYGRNGREITQGTAFKSSPQVRFHLVARKFSDTEQRSAWCLAKGRVRSA